MEDIKENEIGLIKFAWWADFGDPLLKQLEKAGITYQTVDIPHLVGIGGCAYLTFFTGTSGKNWTVLCIPIHYDIDGFAEEYYYFDGNEWPMEKAIESEQRWIDAYEKCRELTKRE